MVSLALYLSLNVTSTKGKGISPNPELSPMLSHGLQVQLTMASSTVVRANVRQQPANSRSLSPVTARFPATTMLTVVVKVKHS